MKSLSQALPLYPQPSGPPAHSQSLVGLGFRTQQDTGTYFLPCCPFCLHFPPSSAEVPWSIIRALFCQHPQLSWLPILWFRPAGSPPALEEFQQPPAWRHPPPPPLPGAKLGKPALGDPYCQTCTQTSSAGLDLSLCPAGHLLSLLSTLQPPTKCLPILNSILLPPPNLLSGLITHHLLHKDNRGQSSQHCICTSSPNPVAEAPSFLGSFCQCPVDPEWPLICISVCAATFPSRFFSSASKKP